MQQTQKWIMYSLVLLMSVLGLSGWVVAAASPQLILDEEYQKIRTQISQTIEKEMRKHQIQGLTIALVADQQLVWAEGFGYADREKGIMAGPKTIYRVGSISKIFTATGVMKLQEQGQVELDQPFDHYLPQFTMQSRFGELKEISLRNMLTHHSGLPGDYLKGMWSKEPIHYSQLVELIQDEYVTAPPEQAFSYSNLGYSLLGNMVEAVTGEDFSSQMDRMVFQPLGMEDTSFALKPDMAPFFSKGYDESQEAEPWGLSTLAAGGAYSNALDLAKFMQIFMAQGTLAGEEYLKAATVEEMLKAQNDQIPLDFDLKTGLGWMLGEFAGTKIAFHSGDTILYHSSLKMLPDAKLGVVILTNTTTGLQVTEELARETLKLAYEMQLDQKLDFTPPKEVSLESIPRATLESYAGNYSTQAGLVVVEAKHGALYMELAGNALKLVPHQEGGFYLRYRVLGLLPLKVPQLAGMEFYFEEVDGHQVMVLSQNGVKTLLGEKMPKIPISKAWQERVGRYEYVNFGEHDHQMIDEMELTYKSGVLQLEFTIPMFNWAGLGNRYGKVIQPLSDHEGIVFGIGKYSGDTVKVVADENGEELLYFSGFYLRKVQ